MNAPRSGTSGLSGSERPCSAFPGRTRSASRSHIGPGAGFAFLSSFLVLFLTFILALFSFLSWPFRFLARTIRGQRAYKKSLVNRVVVLGLDGMEPSLAEKFISEGKLPNLALLKGRVLRPLARRRRPPSPPSPGPPS
jgi:hypothetical protein